MAGLFFAAAAGLMAPGAAAQWLEPQARALVTVLPTPRNGGLTGWRVRAVDDVDGDGVTDFAAAVPFFLGNIGRVAVVSGADGRELWSRAANRTQQSHIFGFSLEDVDDLDGDGVRDVLAGAPFYPGAGGHLHVLSGVDGSRIARLGGRNRLDAFGFAVAAGGDFDGGGTEDIAVGAVGVDIGSNPNAGRVYVYKSSDLSLVTRIDSPNTRQFDFGSGIAFVGDLNGDQRDELAITARFKLNQPPGVLYVFSSDGTTHRPLLTIQPVDLGNGLDGDYVRGGGDVNGDGTPDIYIGEGGASRARVFSGVDGSTIHTFQGAPRLGFGGVGIVDDLNDDGHADVLVGARSSAAGAPGAGMITLYSGRDARVLHSTTSTTQFLSFGSDVDVLGDVDGDGAVDFAVGAMNQSELFVVAGQCYAGWRNYGPGLVGTLGVPALTMAADPVGGSTVGLRVGSSTSSAKPGALLVGLSAASAPSPWGGAFLVTPIASVGLAVPAAGLTVPLAFPGGLSCSDVFLQTVLLDGGAIAGVAESRGLELSLGR